MVLPAVDHRIVYMTDGLLIIAHWPVYLFRFDHVETKMCCFMYVLLYKISIEELVDRDNTCLSKLNIFCGILGDSTRLF